MTATNFAGIVNELLDDPVFKREYFRAGVYVHLANEIYRERTSQSLSQEGLAEKCRVPLSVISKLESGDVDVRLSRVVAIAEALDARLEINFVRRVSNAQAAPSRNKAYLKGHHQVLSVTCQAAT